MDTSYTTITIHVPPQWTITEWLQSLSEVALSVNWKVNYAFVNDREKELLIIIIIIIWLTTTQEIRRKAYYYWTTIIMTGGDPEFRTISSCPPDSKSECKRVDLNEFTFPSILNPPGNTCRTGKSATRLWPSWLLTWSVPVPATISASLWLIKPFRATIPICGIHILILVTRSSMVCSQRDNNVNKLCIIASCCLMASISAAVAKTQKLSKWQLNDSCIVFLPLHDHTLWNK